MRRYAVAGTATSQALDEFVGTIARQFEAAGFERVDSVDDAAFVLNVTDVERSIAFYTEALGFRLDQSMAPAFARVSYHDLTIWLAGPQSSAARPMPDGRRPEPGGWNRFVVEVEDLVSRVAEMKRAGLRFRNDVVVGPGGKQTLLEDPDGNLVELFEAARR